MDNNKVNQSELTYTCGAGQATVNLFTGRLLFSLPDISMGISSYQIGVSHIYNSQLELPSHLNTYLGKGWKLNIEQYLYIENGKYVYVDGAGFKHIFELLIDNIYYDSSGLGLTLSISSGIKKITDEAGNSLVFENEKLVRIVSSENEDNVKQIIYNSLGKIESIYDGRRNQNKLKFYYNGSTGLLNRITCNINSTIVEDVN